jgi:hypothetical protein
VRRVAGVEVIELRGGEDGEDGEDRFSVDRVDYKTAPRVRCSAHLVSVDLLRELHNVRQYIL